MPAVLSESDRLLIQRVRSGDEPAWGELINRFEGRLLAFVEGRLGRQTVGEDVVQETFIGFLNSLPNFDESRSLESYLFSIAAHKLTDHLRREGRRPAISLATGSDGGEWEAPDHGRGVSTLLRSHERKEIEEQAVAEALHEQLARVRERGDWNKLKCLELLFVRNWPNKQIAARLDLTEQEVANYKFDFIERIRALVKKQTLSADVFPELYRAE